MRSRLVLESVGAALLLLPGYILLLLPSNLILYHHSLPVTHLVCGFLLDLLGIAVVVLILLLLLERTPNSLQKLFAASLAGFLLWRIVDVGIYFYNSITIASLHQFTAWGYIRKPACAVAAISVCALSYLAPRTSDFAVRTARYLVAACAFSALWIVPELLHIAFLSARANDTAFSHPPSPVRSGSGRRIIWILFDELSYAQSFEHSRTDVHLPNLEHLRGESISFSNLRPVGFFTERVIPSLFLGQQINEIRSDSEGDLLYRDASTQQWRTFDPNATIFAIARHDGWNPGIVGWYNPYCRILRPVLSSCSWLPTRGILPTEFYGATEEKSAFANAAVLRQQILSSLRGQNSPPAEFHAQEYKSIMADAPKMIEDEQIRFLFLHLPVPHPPGIYNRQTHSLRNSGSYLDNLVLADTALGALLEEINATKMRDQTTIIVSSDHSWRVPLWRSGTDWTKEEEQASGGRFDNRPVLLIHFPGQQSGDEISDPRPELIEHDLIVQMLDGVISSQKDLSTFFRTSSR